MYFLNKIPASTIVLQVLVISQITSTFSTLINSNDIGQEFKSLLEDSIKVWLQNPSSSNIWTQCTTLIVQSTETDNIDDDNNFQIIIPKDKNDAAVFVTKSFDKKLDENPKIQPFAYHQHFSTPCTIVYYFMPIKHFGLFHTDFINGLPGGTFASFHIIFLLQDDIKRGIYKRFQDELTTETLIVRTDDDEKADFRFIKQLHHFVIVENNFNKLHTYNLWFNQTISLNDDDIDRVNNETQFSKFGQSLLFPDKWHNLHGGALAIAATPDTNIPNPVDDYVRTKEVQSVSAAGGVEMLHYFNATPIFTKRSPIFGHKDVNGKWTGLVGAVLDGTSHIAFGIGGSPERAKVITYSHWYLLGKVTFITSLSKQTTAGSIGSLSFLSRPLQGLVWLNIALVFLVIYCLLFYTKYLQQFHKSSKYLSLILLNILLRPVFDQPNQTPSLQSKLRDVTTRILLSQWLLAIIVLSCGYKSNFISILLAPTIIHPPKTFADLASRTNYKIGSTLYNESYMASNFAALNNNIGIEIVKRVKGYPFQSSEGYLAIENFDSQQVFMSISAFLESGAAYFLTDSNGMSLYKVSEDSLFPTTGSIVVPKHFPHLLEPLNTILDRFVENGIVSNLFTLEKRHKAKEGRKLSSILRSTSKDDDKKVDDQGLNHFLTILIVCYGISSSVLVLEILKYYVVDKLSLMKTKVKLIKK